MESAIRPENNKHKNIIEYIRGVFDRIEDRIKSGDQKPYNSMIEHALKLKKTHPDHENYRLYHLIIGSTPRGECPEFDFTGNDAILPFIEKLERDMQVKD